jgi:hypothetical protein
VKERCLNVFHHFRCISTRAVCVFITAVPITKLFAWGEGDSGGHVLRETTTDEPRPVWTSLPITH